ncbi:hypothetical protein [Bosea minatitlanensis]|uniref:DUF4376 domain-containing protein n=1 Tax=Bosea minatitlanensis TaxID=128782 RepID=A0ABW0F126_9HYPH|nr:hypothetical protein [Bosea minatitlanensis]MCT4492684.1 hypothetical protein [Bosea minatitlanensis]
MGERASTKGPWFVSGVRFRMNGGEWHSVNRYDEAKKQDQNIACVGFDPRTGDGLADARLIAAAPDLLEAAKRVLDRGYVSESIEEERGDHLLLAAAIAKAEGLTNHADATPKNPLPGEIAP